MSLLRQHYKLQCRVYIAFDTITFLKCKFRLTNYQICCSYTYALQRNNTYTAFLKPRLQHDDNPIYRLFVD